MYRSTITSYNSKDVCNLNFHAFSSNFGPNNEQISFKLNIFFFECLDVTTKPFQSLLHHKIFQVDCGIFLKTSTHKTLEKLNNGFANFEKNWTNEV
jgi:hypothetical protein